MRTSFHARDNSALPASVSALSDILYSSKLSFIMEAHDALSAAVAAEAGFKAVWASGLSIATCLGYRDTNEASWTQIVDVVERMVDNCNIPVLVDGDSGFGNFNNARLLAKKLSQRGAGGVCLEDKGFPKMNSFIGEQHPLAEMQEFCGRLMAVKDTVPNFVLIARIEALIAGHSMEEALKRADAYHAAGADAILIHSRQADAKEIIDFAKAWADRLPIVIVPTKYYTTPTSEYRDVGISTIIWANHNMRASLAAMQKVCNDLVCRETLAPIEETVASLKTVFQLMNYSELEAAEQRYLPCGFNKHNWRVMP
jgi:phosphoenolpyruvate phosphomutase